MQTISPLPPSHSFECSLIFYICQMNSYFRPGVAKTVKSGPTNSIPRQLLAFSPSKQSYCCESIEEITCSINFLSCSCSGEFTVSAEPAWPGDGLFLRRVHRSPPPLSSSSSTTTRQLPQSKKQTNFTTQLIFTVVFK